jgi:hypothetical protein
MQERSGARSAKRHFKPKFEYNYLSQRQRNLDRGTQGSTGTMQIRRVKPQLRDDDVSDAEAYASSDSDVPQFEDEDEDMIDAGSDLEAAAEGAESTDEGDEEGEEVEEGEEKVRPLHNACNTIAEC